MAYFLFLDESGQDGRNSPYEVLAGVSVADRDLWNLVRALQDAEVRQFGRRYTDGHERELKASKILKRKTFRLARQMESIAPDLRREAAKRALDNGAAASRLELTALSQAKLAYVEEVFELCARFRCRFFASVVAQNALRPDPSMLRKDYTYLFERFYYFLEDVAPNEMGIVVFDESEKSQSHLLLNQMSDYFLQTSKGRQRSGQIVPEPLFVHSDLTTGVQIADLVAYIVSWQVRFRPNMTQPRREELEGLGEQVCGLRHLSRQREIEGYGLGEVWSFCYLEDLRSRFEREND